MYATSGEIPIKPITIWENGRTLANSYYYYTEVKSAILYMSMIYDIVGLVKSKTTSMLKTERREKKSARNDRWM